MNSVILCYVINEICIMFSKQCDLMSSRQCDLMSSRQCNIMLTLWYNVNFFFNSVTGCLYEGLWFSFGTQDSFTNKKNWLHQYKYEYWKNKTINYYYMLKEQCKSKYIISAFMRVYHFSVYRNSVCELHLNQYSTLTSFKGI